jgi:hypothetical protein
MVAALLFCSHFFTAPVMYNGHVAYVPLRHVPWFTFFHLQ